MKIEVANGEIVDKLTILQIKLENSDSEEKTQKILQELNYLQPLVEGVYVPKGMVDDLREVNQKIWDTEDSIRLCEKNNQFDDVFIGHARDVYYNNDKRFHVKARINQHTGSNFTEQKILPDYYQ